MAGYSVVGLQLLLIASIVMATRGYRWISLMATPERGGCPCNPGDTCCNDLCFGGECTCCGEGCFAPAGADCCSNGLTCAGDSFCCEKPGAEAWCCAGGTVCCPGLWTCCEASKGCGTKDCGLNWKVPFITKRASLVRS